MKQFICRFGVPLLIHSDQGRNFESELFAEMCRLLCIKKTRTTPYHPQSEGMVERFNCTLEAQLSMFADHKQKDWDEHIPFLLMAYRSATHDTTHELNPKVVHRNRLWRYSGMNVPTWYHAPEQEQSYTVFNSLWQQSLSYCLLEAHWRK